MAIEAEHLKAIHQFAASAETFCILLQNHMDVPDEEFPTRCAKAMAALYRDVLDLPYDENFVAEKYGSDETLINIKMPKEYFSKSLFERFESQQRDLYWIYFDPFDPTSNMHFTLYMTLLEIYENIIYGLEYYHLGTDFGLYSAANSWKGMFLVHWGQHLTDGLRAMHEIIYQDFSKPIPQPEDDDEQE